MPTTTAEAQAPVDRSPVSPDPSMASAIQPVAHETRDRIITGFLTIAPFLLLGVAAWQVWNNLLHWHDLVVFAIVYIPCTARDHGRLPPPAHPPRLQDESRAARRSSPASARRRSRAP